MNNRPLPSGWSTNIDNSNLRFYVNDITTHSQYEYPGGTSVVNNLGGGSRKRKHQKKSKKSSKTLRRK